ncbi:hypothetical protein KM043_000680 [Ampulex compressa]|nr:hypothetical protein KM043_000680 [Ampulex compressa]
MNAVLIPFFLAARLAVEAPWEHGPEYTFRVHVSSTAIPEEGTYGSVRLNLASKLICQPKRSDTLSCHFRDSKADSFMAKSLDPGVPAVPSGQVCRQEAYEINQDQFEIKFNEHGLESLIVNENIQPRELDMIRVIVEQLDIGVILGDIEEETFALMENFTQGECVTTFQVDRKIREQGLYPKRAYALEPVFGMEDGQLVQIRKVRNLHACTHKVPYFFGSAESLRQVSDVLSTVNSSDSHIIITSADLISATSNVITTNKITEAIVTTLYENISLSLESIQPAEDEPPPVKDAEPASIFIGEWLMESSSEEDS